MDQQNLSLKKNISYIGIIHLQMRFKPALFGTVLNFAYVLISLIPYVQLYFVLQISSVPNLTAPDSFLLLIEIFHTVEHCAIQCRKIVNRMQKPMKKKIEKLNDRTAKFFIGFRTPNFLSTNNLEFSRSMFIINLK